MNDSSVESNNPIENSDRIAQPNGNNQMSNDNPAITVQEARNSLSSLSFEKAEQLLTSKKTIEQLTEEEKTMRETFLQSGTPLANAPDVILDVLTNSDLTTLITRDLSAGVKMDRSKAPWITLTEINRGDFSKALKRNGRKEESVQTEELAKMFKLCLPDSTLNILDELESIWDGAPNERKRSFVFKPKGGQPHPAFDLLKNTLESSAWPRYSSSHQGHSLMYDSVVHKCPNPTFCIAYRPSNPAWNEDRLKMAMTIKLHVLGIGSEYKVLRVRKCPGMRTRFEFVIEGNSKPPRVLLESAHLENEEGMKLPLFFGHLGTCRNCFQVGPHLTTSDCYLHVSATKATAARNQRRKSIPPPPAALQKMQTASSLLQM